MGGRAAAHVAPPHRAIGSGGAAVWRRPHSPSRASLCSAYSLRAANKGGRCRPPLGRAGHRIGAGTGRERGLGLLLGDLDKCLGDGRPVEKMRLADLSMPLKRLPVICPSSENGSARSFGRA